MEHSPQGVTEPEANNILVGTQYTHQMFNNIVCRLHIEGTKRYDPFAGGGYGNPASAQPGDYVGCCANRYSASHSNELADYNFYYRPASMTTDAKFINFMRGQGDALSFSSLAAWRAHSEFAHSKLSGTYRAAFLPGWEANSTDTKPIMATIDDFPTRASRDAGRSLRAQSL